MSHAKMVKQKSERYPALDLLRGYFIVIIISDHLWRWPSIFSFFSGKALLWVTAAEGFVIISGLLVGYIRGFKARHEPLRDIAKKIWKRALILYTWAVIGTVVYTAAIWYIPLIGGGPGMPVEKGEWGQLLFESLTLTYTFVWVYFLKLYAIFLAFSPIALWLLRKNKAWLAVAISFGVLAIGWLTQNEVLQWQFLFFIPVVIGYYMKPIQYWWKSKTKTQRGLLSGVVIGSAIITITLSVISIFHPAISQTLVDITATYFAKDSISLWRALAAFLWFAAYLLVFIYLEKYINRVFGWALNTIGTRSLTAYILHGVALIIISFFVTANENDTFLFNTLLNVLAILIVWFLLKLPGINRVIPR